MRRWASVLIRGVVQETPAPRRPACPARESGTAVPDKRTKAVPGDEPRDHSPRSITYMEPSRIYVDEFLPQLWTFVSYPLLYSSFSLPISCVSSLTAELRSTQENSKIVIRVFLYPSSSSFVCSSAVVCSARVVRRPRMDYPNGPLRPVRWPSKSLR